MAEADGQEKTEDPTGRRISQAEEKGQVPRSKEMGTALVLLAGVIGLSLVGGSIGRELLEVGRRNFSFTRDEVFDPQQMLVALTTDVINMVPAMGWLFFMLVLAALIGNLFIGGMNFSSQAMMPNFAKLNPLTGIKRLVGVQSLIELVKSIGKVLFIGLMTWILIRGQLPYLLALSQRQLPFAIYDALERILWLAIGICCALLPIVALDVPFQLWHYKHGLKMTKQEVKDEFKDSEGKPEVKGRIRRMQMEIANRRMMAEVPKADVIVTNPTHYAVALRYDHQHGKAPVVVAKGVDEIAMMIRKIAGEYSIPQVASPALARAIYHTTKLEHEIPEGLFIAVAQVLAYVYQMQAWRQGKGTAPNDLSRDLPIPDEYRY